MSSAARVARDERKALLVARAELDRAKVTLAVQEIRAIVAPPPSPERLVKLRPFAKYLVAIAVPMLGFRRLRRVLRFASMAVYALRVVRGWR